MEAKTSTRPDASFWARWIRQTFARGGRAPGGDAGARGGRAPGAVRARAMRIEGRVITDAEIAPEWDVKFTDEVRGTVLGHTAVSGDGAFAFEIGKLKPKGQPQLTFWISRGDRLIAVLEPEMSWDGEGATTVELRVSAPPKATYLLAGRVWDEAAGGGV